MNRDDYLEALRERYGPDAATREPDDVAQWAETYEPCGPGCPRCARGDPCISTEYDPADDRSEIRSATTPGKGA